MKTVGNFLTTILSNAESIGTATTTVQKDLPRSNFIAGIAIRMVLTGTSPTATLSRIQVLGNGSAAIVDLTGAELQAYLKYVSGINGAGADGAATADYYLPFNRFWGDTAAMLAAKAFRTLSLKMTWTLGGTVTASAMDISTIEVVSDVSVYEVFQLRLVETGTIATTGTSGNKDLALPLGSVHRHYLVSATGTDGTTVSEFSVRLNNGSEIPVNQRWVQNQVLNTQVRSGLTAVVANFAFIDFDPDRSFGYALQSGVANDITLRCVQGANTQTIALVLADAVLIPK